MQLFMTSVAMGHYGVYVWSATGIVVLTLIGHWVVIKREARRLHRELTHLCRE